MENHTISCIMAVIAHIESHLEEKLNLDALAAATSYSKFHLHRMFTSTVGLTMHDYIQRRQLTEAAKLLVFSEKPILEIALTAGFESQQAFTAAFKSIYKQPPAEYRDRGVFYPLQLQFTLYHTAANTVPDKSHIRLAEHADIPAWMELVRLVIDGYPHLEEADYLCWLREAILKKQALILTENHTAIGAMAFCHATGGILFMGVHPQHRSRGIQKLFLDKLMEDLLPQRDISVTTYRQGDKADTGYRDELMALGFAERELLVEFGYPTQRFVLPANH